MIQVVNFFLDEAFAIAVHIGSRNMSERLKFLTLICEIQHTPAAEVVDLNGV